MFTTLPSGRVGLRPDTHTTGRTATGQTYSITVDARGHREPAVDAPRWLIAGDSMAFGLGVADADTTAAQLVEAGAAVRSVAVPGHTVADALAAVTDALAADPAVEGVVVWLNPADDDRQHTDPAAHARTVVAGHAVHADTPAFLQALVASPLSRLQVGHTLLQGAGLARQLLVRGPARIRRAITKDGGYDAFHDIAAAVADTAVAHPCVSFVVLWVPLPGEAVPDRAAPSALERRDLPIEDHIARYGLDAGRGTVPLVDVTDRFVGRDDAYLPHDTHLSPAGHALVADALTPLLAATEPRCP